MNDPTYSPNELQNVRYETERELTTSDLAEIEALQRLALVELAKHPAKREGYGNTTEGHTRELVRHL